MKERIRKSLLRESAVRSEFIDQLQTDRVVLHTSRPSEDLRERGLLRLGEQKLTAFLCSVSGNEGVNYKLLSYCLNRN